MWEKDFKSSQVFSSSCRWKKKKVISLFHSAQEKIKHILRSLKGTGSCSVETQDSWVIENTFWEIIFRADHTERIKWPSVKINRIRCSVYLRIFKVLVCQYLRFSPSVVSEIFQFAAPGLSTISSIQQTKKTVFWPLFTNAFSFSNSDIHTNT